MRGPERVPATNPTRDPEVTKDPEMTKDRALMSPKDLAYLAIVDIRERERGGRAGFSNRWLLRLVCLGNAIVLLALL